MIRKVKQIIPLAKKIVHHRGLRSINHNGRATVPEAAGVPSGHFYSPVPSLEEVKRDEKRIFNIPESLAGIDMNIDEQLSMLSALANYYQEIPFQPTKTRGLRYCFINSMYSYSDAICLYGMIRHLRPKRIIEVGAGYSSCVMLDTNELFFHNQIECTFIEPHPETFLSLIKWRDRKRIELLTERVQDVDVSKFSELSANDILFIDSTHVSKAGSDVNHLLFDVLPTLQSSVYVHFHDVLYPFEYPRRWFFELGLAWNEAYLLRAFLQYNEAFRIVFFNTFMEHFYTTQVRALMPLCFQNTGGSLWLRRV